MNWSDAKYLQDPIPCNGVCCTNIAVYWLDADETDEIIFLCERCIALWIVDRINDDTQESGVWA